MATNMNVIYATMQYVTWNTILLLPLVKKLTLELLSATEDLDVDEDITKCFVINETVSNFSGDKSLKNRCEENKTSDGPALTEFWSFILLPSNP